MHETLIDQGLNLMLFGMGTVFVFLTLSVNKSLTAMICKPRLLLATPIQIF